MAKPSKTILYRRELYAALALALPVSSMAAVLPVAGVNGPSVSGGDVPVVQIVTPNGAGVSHNQFTQFDVGSNGTVLNNSGTAIASQLAGQIDGNSNLANGTAKVIIAEVTGSAASKLNGALEIAGDKAALIVANPNGISANGASFINASRVTLATGTPQLDNDGKVTSINVSKGIIDVSGKGVDASGVEMADLMARSIALNAELKAKSLRVVTGANSVSYTSNGNSIATSRIDAEGEAPKLALDVASLGGMYADSIRMVGTEKGVGVNVAGTVQATTTASLGSGGAMTIAKGGVVKATSQVAVDVASDLINAGTLSATTGRVLASATAYGPDAAKSRRFISTGTLEAGGKAQASGFTFKKVSGTITTGDAQNGLGVLHDDANGTIVGSGTLGVDSGEALPPEPETKPEPEPETKPETKPEPEPETKPETKPEPQPETKPEAKPDPQPETKPEAKPEPQPETKPEAKPEPQPETKPETKPEPEPETKPQHKPSDGLSSFDPWQALEQIWSNPSYGSRPWAAPSFGYSSWSYPSFGFAPWMPAYYRPQPVFSPWQSMGGGYGMGGGHGMYRPVRHGRY